MRINLKHLFIAVLVFIATNTFAQVGIGTNTPAASAALEVTSDTNNKGILIPRMTATQKDAISNPAEGLMIFQTSAPVGFYFYTGASWRLMVTQTDLDLKVAKVSGKDLSSNDYTTAEKTKVSNQSGINTGDQDLSALATTSATTTALNLKVDKVAGERLIYATEITTLSNQSGTNTGDQDLSALASIAVLELKANTTDVNTSLALKANTTDVTNSLALKAPLASPTLVTPNIGVATGTSLSVSGQLTSTIAIGAAPLVVSSTTPVANLSIGGNAATATLASTVTTNADLSGDVTSSGSNATTVKQINGTALSGLATGILKNTTTTGVPSIAVAADFPTLNQNTTGTADNVTGTVAVANGGTGLTTTPTNGQLDIGNGTGFTRTTLTAGTGILVTNNAGSITIANSTPGLPTANQLGEMLYWDGSAWVKVIAGTDGQTLFSKNGVPTWGTLVGAFVGTKIAGETLSPYSGRIWMDRNLGATRVATNFKDELAYGSLYQWGRGSDGHELITWTDANTGTAINSTTTSPSSSNTPSDNFFILGTNDWLSSQNNDLWQGVNGTNNPCPSGFRLPTIAEWTAESFMSSIDAFRSIQVPFAGFRYYTTGTVESEGYTGFYWSSTVSSNDVSYVQFLERGSFDGTTIRFQSFPRTMGLSVRCIKN
jgi:hypothetical protein